MQPAAPNIAEQATQPFAAPAFQEKADRIPTFLTRCADIVCRARFRAKARQGIPRQRIEHDLQLLHFHAPTTSESQILDEAPIPFVIAAKEVVRKLTVSWPSAVRPSRQLLRSFLRMR